MLLATTVVTVSSSSPPTPPVVCVSSARREIIKKIKERMTDMDEGGEGTDNTDAEGRGGGAHRR